MRKFVYMLVLSAIIVFSVTGCEPSDDSDVKMVKTIEGIYDSGNVYVYVDPETGVNYLIFYGTRRGGMSPRYNADGSLYVTERSDNHDGE